MPKRAPPLRSAHAGSCRRSMDTALSATPTWHFCHPSSSPPFRPLALGFSRRRSLRLSLLGSFHANVVHDEEKPVRRLEQLVGLGGRCLCRFANCLVEFP